MLTVKSITMFKRGETVKCVKGNGKLLLDHYYECVSDEYCSRSGNRVVVDIDGKHYNSFSVRFVSVEREENDNPTLSDFDKVRLETAARFFMREGGMETALEYADYLIGLIRRNPFPYERTEPNPSGRTD